MTENSELKTDFTEMMGIKYPIVCAPMFLVSNEDLVVAASEAGALGTFPAHNYRPIEKFKSAIHNIRKRTDKPFGINIIVQKSNKEKDRQIDIALEEKTPLLITSLGNPKSTIEKAHSVGSKVFCDVVNLEHGKKVVDLGADGLIAVGSGAGGHAGDISLFSLIPYLKKNLNVPVLAAGNIVNGRGMLAAFSLGASAAYMGTRFIASTEANVDEEYKKAILDAGCESIVNTDRVDGFPGNFIKTERLVKHGIEPGFFETLARSNASIDRAFVLYRAAKVLMGDPTNKISYKNIYSAGQGSGLIESIKSVQEIIDDTMKEYHSLKADLP